ncbi:MAG: cellulase family glycosylhydrolase [Chloroflexi bacterium]|nr:cellulase family glycosylhydrolase [Chloroflexota bacterium]
MRRSLRLVVSASLLVVLVASGSPATTTLAQADPRYFSQTGYRIDNDAFWNFFQGRGGVPTFGYPVSRQFKLVGFQVQIFQRLVMQLQPDGSVQTLNLLDPGLMPYTQINGSTYPAPDPAVVGATPPVSDPNYNNAIIAFTQQTAPDTFEGQPVNYFQTFSNTVTCDDAFPNQPCQQNLLPGLNLQIWGAPTSNPTYDPTNHNFIYQRFQRSIMHFDAGCQCTQGLLLADYFKSIITGQNLPLDLDVEARNSIYYKQYDPSKPLSIARPDQLTNSDLTNAFTPSQPGGGGNVSPVGPVNSTWGYGMSVQLWYFSQDAKGQTVGLIQQAGFNWMKVQVQWSTVETAPGQFDWSQLDQIVSTANTGGLKILMSVVDAPSFYQTPTSGLTPGDPNTFKTFMQTVAARYAGKVQAYEIWNEQNLSREMGSGNVDPSHYLPLLMAGYTGLKAGDTNVLALLGAPSPTGANIPGESIDDLQYLQQLFALNGGQALGYFDAVSAHPSGFSNPPNCTPATPQCSLSGAFNDNDSFFAFTRVSQYHDLMVAQGIGNKKIWFTEFGYCSNDTPPPGYEYCKSIDASTQASFLVQAFQMARNLDYVGGMMQWNLNYQLAVPQTDEKWGFGIIRNDWSGRPAYSALAQMPKS